MLVGFMTCSAAGRPVPSSQTKLIFLKFSTDSTLNIVLRVVTVVLTKLQYYIWELQYYIWDLQTETVIPKYK